MKEGEDYEDAFAPVQHATSARVIISLAAADDLELHSCDLAQAFIQADKLDEGVNGRVFITQPKGSDEEPDTVFEEFTTTGFEDSIWVREAGGEYEDRLIASAHIDDTLMA
mmetsp:Transcript_23114/g.54805  ORF Transcript_23114/g.54805 Transcript_23114/m.54805 type:complete len:111 (-) Transcript_23114:2112-2444(-)